jgi:O-acetyl-ADP-ribose deacetylase (regulator of RNase III)
MTDNIDWLITELLREQKLSGSFEIPITLEEKRRLVRHLMNIRPPWPAAEKLLKAQDRELTVQLLEKGIVPVDQIEDSFKSGRIKLWQGDITRLAVDAIVNAANSGMLGCFYPLHGCIDNAIHSAAGMRMRLECDRQMREHGHPEPTGKARITKGYNLPAKFVLHTVGPIITNDVSETDSALLASCYKSCLAIAEENKLKSIAFCCISTGEYRFPNQLAAEIAVGAIMKHIDQHADSTIDTIIFNVFKDEDYAIYKKLLK